MLPLASQPLTHSCTEARYEQ